MVDKFKQRLKKEGRSLRWFHDTYIVKQLGISYNAMALQLNGYVGLSDALRQLITRYTTEGKSE